MDTAAVPAVVEQIRTRLETAPQMDEQTTKLRIITPSSTVSAGILIRPTLNRNTHFGLVNTVP